MWQHRKAFLFSNQVNIFDTRGQYMVFSHPDSRKFSKNQTIFRLTKPPITQNQTPDFRFQLHGPLFNKIIAATNLFFWAIVN